MMHYKQQLQNLQKGSLLIMDYVEKKISLADNLADTFYEVSEADLVACILHGLDASHRRFHTALNIRIDPISVDELLELLLHEEEKLGKELKL